MKKRALAFYKFVEVNDPLKLRDHLENVGTTLALKGTILVAEEGVNGTIVGDEKALDGIHAALNESVGEVIGKRSDLDSDNPGFYRFKVKVKPEIVSFGVAGLDVANQTGEHVDPKRWNELLDDPDVVVIDTRNTYEIDIGTFPSAISPQTTNFREFPQWVADHLDPEQQPRVAMFCTGGIRCEKASAHMLAQGFEAVYQLDGGILSYLEHVEEDQNRWQGECFVFDQRVSVDHTLNQGQYDQCFACRHPVSEADQQSPQYEPGVSCPHCYEKRDSASREGFRERQKQVELAEARGDQHVGRRQGLG